MASGRQARRYFTLGVIACAGSLCWAEETTPSALVSLSTVNITGHYDNAVGTSDAASQGSVSATLIANRPTGRTGEILEFVPGLIVSQHSGDGKANQYYLRGFNLDHGTDFATYVDGMPVNMRTHAHGQGYSDMNFLIPELVKRIDYKKGPYFADEGDFASAGSAHLRLVDSLPKGLASLTVGGYQFARALLANSSAWGDGKLLYALDLNRYNGPWENPEGLRKFSSLLKYSEGSLDKGYSLTAMAYSARWNATDQIPLRAVESGLMGRFGAVDPTDGGNSSRYSLSFASHHREADSLLEFNAYAIQSRLALYSNFTYATDNPVGLDQFLQKESRQVAGLDLRKSWFGQFQGKDMVNKLGLQSRLDWLSPIGLYQTTARQPTAVNREDRVRESSVGVYFENGIQWNDKLRTVAGLRHDAYAFNVASNIAANSGQASAQITSPKLSVILGPWSKTEFFANYGQGFHSNDARGTTLTVTPKEGLPIAPVTPLAKTRGSELGLRTQLVDGLQSSLALWRLDIASELVFSGDAGDTSPSRPSRRVGVEWNNHYVANKWLLLDVDLSASRARYTQLDPAGNFIPGAVNRVASLGVSVTDFHQWFGSWQWRYFGPRPLVEDNSVKSAGTLLTNLRLGYRFSAHTRLVADIFNLLDRKASDIDYYYTSRLKSEVTAQDGIVFHPVEPRTLRVSLIHHF